MAVPATGASGVGSTVDASGAATYSREDGTSVASYAQEALLRFRRRRRNGQRPMRQSCSPYRTSGGLEKEILVMRRMIASQNEFVVDTRCRLMTELPQISHSTATVRGPVSRNTTPANMG